MDSLISKESFTIIEEVKSFLEGTDVEITIGTEAEKVNAVSLGNALQKKYKVIEDTRKKEKGVWDAKAKAVQEEFKPILDVIDSKKKILSGAITKWDQKVELERQARQRELECTADAERKKLEAFAGKREEKLALYVKKLADAQTTLQSCREDVTQTRVILREISYLQAKVREFSAKLEETIQQAQAVQAPVYVPEARESSSGTRKRMVARVDVADKQAFIRWCLQHDELQFLSVNDAIIRDRIKETEGRFQAEGVVTSYVQETGFSGR